MLLIIFTIFLGQQNPGPGYQSLFEQNVCVCTHSHTLSRNEDMDIKKMGIKKILYRHIHLVHKGFCDIHIYKSTYLFI